MENSKIKYFFELIVFLIVEIIIFMGISDFIDLFIFLDDFYALQQTLFLFCFFGLNGLFLYILFNNSKQEKTLYLNSLNSISNCDYSKLKLINAITIKSKKLCFETKNGDIFIELNYILNFDENTILKIDNFLMNYADKSKFNADSLSFLIIRLLKK